MANGLTYREAGVDMDAGDALVEAIKPFAKKTLRPEILAGIGGVGALAQIPQKKPEPPLLSGTHRGRTQPKLALPLQRHDTTRIDLVAMSGNDNITPSGQPP